MCQGDKIKMINLGATIIGDLVHCTGLEEVLILNTQECWYKRRILQCYRNIKIKLLNSKICFKGQHMTYPVLAPSKIPIKNKQITV